MSFDIHEIPLDCALSQRLKSWKECNARFLQHTIQSDPDWIAEHFKHAGSVVSNLEQLDFGMPWSFPKDANKKNLRVYFLQKGSEIVSSFHVCSTSNI